MVLTRQGDPPGLVLTGVLEAVAPEVLRAAVLAPGRPAHPDVRLDLRAVPFLRTAELRVLCAMAAELAQAGRSLVLELAEHHEWAIRAIGWAGAPGLVLANGDMPR
ncbi:STAS domain-containing protein [Actinosynnema sp. NPDC047251]|uniref:MlaB-like STAS domain-containing protein n=1 Tax=Saccharothrix espanaensis (strain ATCC 51144 / DSM 44229 / JCM 9112 / NBRC 15066 / NRRL 15764) TaxID=1179773 RepID=K0JWC7_SACES|nr:STAS domain-containing protein [Saccharothrix espanaensis]CCH30356.1 hypothetical protein BN6_30490 [Saccharothrix espanaensis DSM 44229]